MLQGKERKGRAFYGRLSPPLKEEIWLLHLCQASVILPVVSNNWQSFRSTVY
jgi:hypothetical protein